MTKEQFLVQVQAAGAIARRNTPPLLMDGPDHSNRRESLGGQLTSEW